MDTIALSLFSLFFFFFIKPTTSNTCAPSSCHPAGPQVRFPFYLSNRQPLSCGFPGFNLFCNNNNQTILNLPSGEVIVRRISYAAQSVIIDPQFCLPDRINDFSLDGTPFFDFYLYELYRYTIFNCSSDFLGAPRYAPVSPVSVTFNCLSGPNYTVVAMPSYYGGDAIMPASCRNISTIAIPIRRYQKLGGDEEELELRWFMPGCSACESNGGTCGTSAADPLDVICYRGHTRGLPRSAKYGIIFGLGAPSLLCIFALIYFIKKKAQAQSQAQNQSLQHRGIDLSSIIITPRPTLLMGLDGPTIESYPKTILGESKRLPKPNDGTCPICLSDYEPKDELRTIPECNHYFHAGCIDEWLRLNATCPLCRNMPESSVVTPCTSTSPSAATSSNPTTSS